MGNQEEREKLLEDKLTYLTGTVSNVLRDIRDITSVSIRPITNSGFPTLGETTRVLGKFDDGISLVGERPFFEVGKKTTFRTFYLHRNGEQLVYELDQFLKYD